MDMAKPIPIRTAKSGFVIKLSCETTEKLAKEELQAKSEDEAANSEPKSNDRPMGTENVSGKDCKVANEKHVAASDRTPDETVGSVDCELDSSTGSSAASEVKNAAAWGEYAPYVTYEGDTAVYTDPASRLRYTWSTDSDSWQPQPQPGAELAERQYSYENDTHVYTEPDGSKFFYDPEKKAWIPKVDDDFLALYQMSYGFVDNTSKEEVNKDEASKKVEKDKKSESAGVKRKNEPQWFEASDETNTKVYVSNLPQDLTEEEFVELMGKCGLVERDPKTQKMRVKLYTDKESGCFKGDALCTYIKVESVDLALRLLDGSRVRGNTIHVQRAHFQLKGEYNPALKPKKKKKKELEKIKKMQQKLFDWRPEKFVGERSKHERVVIIKNLFNPSDFDKEVGLILDYQADLREECGKAGDVRKVTLYDRHPEGVAQVTMKEPEQADAVVALINGRWFGKRQITAEIWDGRTKYRIAETDADISKRIDKWEKFLETGAETNDSLSTSKDTAHADSQAYSSTATHPDSQGSSSTATHAESQGSSSTATHADSQASSSTEADADGSHVASTGDTASTTEQEIDTGQHLAVACNKTETEQKCK